MRLTDKQMKDVILRLRTALDILESNQEDAVLIIGVAADLNTGGDVLNEHIIAVDVHTVAYTDVDVIQTLYKAELAKRECWGA